MKYFKKIVGERLYLSPMNVEDAETYVNWLNSRGVSDNLGMTSSVVTVPGEKEYIESKKNNDYDFSIVLNDDTIIGNISLMHVDLVSGKATLGIFIGDEENRNKGYGTEAINLLLEYGFRYLNLHSIRLDLLDVNERAHRCYLKCGFKDSGRTREAIFINGKYYDKLHMDILEKEFKGDYIRNKNV